jgi:hypothetical protein
MVVSKVKSEVKELEVGWESPTVSYELTRQIISKYEEAVENHSSLTNLIPPLAILAYAMKAVFQYIDIPPGSLHTSQEVESFKTLTVGSWINYRARVTQQSRHFKRNFTTIELSAFGQNEELVLSATTTLITPS